MLKQSEMSCRSKILGAPTLTIMVMVMSVLPNSINNQTIHHVRHKKRKEKDEDS